TDLNGGTSQEEKGSKFTGKETSSGEGIKSTEAVLSSTTGAATKTKIANSLKKGALSGAGGGAGNANGGGGGMHRKASLSEPPENSVLGSSTNRHYNSTTAALLTNFLLNNASSSSNAFAANGGLQGGGPTQPTLSGAYASSMANYLEYTFPRGHSQRARQRAGHHQQQHRSFLHDQMLISDHHSLLNGTIGSDSPEIHSSTGSEPLLYDYNSRLAAAAAAASSNCLPSHPHFNPLHHPITQLPHSLHHLQSSANGSVANGQHQLVAAAVGPAAATAAAAASASAYATDSSLSQNSVLSDYFSCGVAGGGGGGGTALLTPEPEDDLQLVEEEEACSMYPSTSAPHHHSSNNTYPGSGGMLGSYCSALGGQSAYYHHHQHPPPPPPPPTVISEHAPSGGGGGNGSNHSSKAPSLLYLAHNRQQPSNYISAAVGQHQQQHASYTSQSTSPPVLPPPPFSYHPLPAHTSGTSCSAYPDYNQINYQQQQYSMQHQTSHQTSHQPNLVTIYNQATGTTRSFCTTLPNGGNGSLSATTTSNKPLHPHHHHHHHLYHYHLPPDHPANIKLLSNTTINATPLLQPTTTSSAGKVPLYATLQQSGKLTNGHRIEASTTGGSQAKVSRAVGQSLAGNGTLCSTAAAAVVYNSADGSVGGGGYPGQQRHLNGNCIANHDQTMLRRGSAATGVSGGGGLFSEQTRNQTVAQAANMAGNHLTTTAVLETAHHHQQQHNSQLLQRDQITGAGGGQQQQQMQSQQTRVVEAGGNFGAGGSGSHSSQAEMMVAEMNRNKQAAEQEAQLRELKGYEASYQYQPRSVYLDGMASTSGGPGGMVAGLDAAGHPIAGGSSSGGNPADLLPPLINTNANLMLPGADKRSCSQWRMTLFVFYWIIWIVFLIGVVIIVAANARTASGSFPGQNNSIIFVRMMNSR
ncbi:hypothetical protein TYRP_013665, partial [Tyrophagus putrescentiae]